MTDTEIITYAADRIAHALGYTDKATGQPIPRESNAHEGIALFPKTGYFVWHGPLWSMAFWVEDGAIAAKPLRLQPPDDLLDAVNAVMDGGLDGALIRGQYSARSPLTLRVCSSPR